MGGGMNIKIGGNVGGTINISDGDLVIFNGKVQEPQRQTCRYCGVKSEVPANGKCPHCGGAYKAE